MSDSCFFSLLFQLANFFEETDQHLAIVGMISEKLQEMRTLSKKISKNGTDLQEEFEKNFDFGRMIKVY